MSYREKAQLMYESGDLRMAELFMVLAIAEKSKEVGAF